MAVQEEQPNKIIKTSNDYSTTETSKTLPTEIILEIFLRLSVAALLRCKSVCKLWLSLISDTHFVKSHLKLSHTNNNNDYARYQLASSSFPINSLKTCPLNDVLFARSDVNVLDHGYPLRRRPNVNVLDHVSIVGSCNGLLCIVFDKATPFICNPSTRIWNQVPYCGFPVRNILYGFAYDKLTDDYKVFGIFRVLRHQGNNDYKCVTTANIYSLKTRKWKDIAGIPRGIPLSNQHGKFLNGAIHWAAESKSSDRWVIDSLDLAKETYGQVSQPVYNDGDHKKLRFGVLGEWLCVLFDYGNHADVWVMKVYGVKDSWTKLVSIPYPTTQRNWWSRSPVPLFVSVDGKFLLQLGLGLVVYDSNNNSSSVIENFDECLEACTFVESLVSPNAVAA